MRVKPRPVKYLARLPAMKPPPPVITIKSSFFSFESFSTSLFFSIVISLFCSISPLRLHWERRERKGEHLPVNDDYWAVSCSRMIRVIRSAEWPSQSGGGLTARRG